MKIYDYNGKKNICGDRLREARVVRRLRQEDLAAQIQLKGINMERDSISRIEIGTRFVSDFELKIFAEAHEGLLLPPVQRIRTRHEREHKQNDTAVLAERNGLPESNRRIYSARRNVDQQLPARDFRL